MGDALDDFIGGSAEWPFSSRRTGRPGLSSEKAHIRREITKLNARLAELDEAANRFGDEPPVGTVVTFQKRFPNSLKAYSYAALRVGAERAVGTGWFLTGRDGKQPRTWEWLTDFIGDGPFRIILPYAYMEGPGGEVVAFTPDKAPDWSEIARLARKTSLALERHKRPGNESPSFKVASTSQNDLLGEGAPNPAAPFHAVRALTTPHWEVVNRVTGELKTVFPTDRDGERRARQSAHDRNRAVWDGQYAGGHTEPPVGSRVRSKGDLRLWAERRAGGWVRFNGDTIQAIRLSWPSVRRQLKVVEPGQGRTDG
jgi:hypothetical protein